MDRERFRGLFPDPLVKDHVEDPVCTHAEWLHVRYVLALLEGRERSEEIGQPQRGVVIASYDGRDRERGDVLFKRDVCYGEPSGMCLTGPFAGLVVWRDQEWLPYEVRVMRGLIPYRSVFFNEGKWLDKVAKSQLPALVKVELQEVVAEGETGLFLPVYLRVIQRLGFEVDEAQFVANVQRYMEEFGVGRREWEEGSEEVQIPL